MTPETTQEVLFRETPPISTDAWDDIAKEIKDMLRRKQADYGEQNILQTGHLGLSVRLVDKSARLLHLVRKGEENPHFESVRDTYLDTAGYGIIGALLLDGRFPPEKENNQ